MKTKSVAANGSRDSPEASRAIVPQSHDLKKIRHAAQDCQACPLWKNATQTVFGEGKKSASIFLVGEQPGDQEDKQGRPFVGPAGMLLDRALKEAGIERDACYLTNAVKHFKWEPRGKRRLHQKPSAREIAACRPWLEAELDLIAPGIIICLGATAAAAVIGPAVRVLRDRGKLLVSRLGKPAFVTVHPSLLLRIPDRKAAEKEYKHFVHDLQVAASILEKTKSPAE